MDVYNLKQMWGALALRGMLTILFGIAAIFWPGLTLVTLVYLFGAYVVVSGLINQIVGLTNIGNAGASVWARVLLVILGGLEVGLGVYLIRHPKLTFATFILLIGLSFIIRGLFELFAGLFGDNKGGYRALLILGGLLSCVVGVILLFQPVAGGVAFVWVIGIYALIVGPLLVALAFEAKNAVAPKTKAAR